MYIRYCPKCGKELHHINEQSYKIAIRNNRKCNSCSSKGAENNIKRLLSNELESFYWIGFIAADGHIEKNKRLSITLSIKDEEHLKKFYNYCSIKSWRKQFTKLNKKEYEYVSLSAQDTINVPKLVEKFDLKHNKTYYPPNINIFKKLKNEELLAFIIGFIDGDGSIKYQPKRKDWCIRLKTHSSWLDILRLFQETICNKNTTKINNKGYASVIITDVPATIELKKFALENKLPILKRKWDKIDLDYKTFYQIANENKENIKRLAEQDKTMTEISKELGLSYSCVRQQIIKNKIKVKLDERKYIRRDYYAANES